MQPLLLLTLPPSLVAMSGITAAAVKQHQQLTSELDSYYVLVATCVLGKNSEWLKAACLAAALLLPAVAALHGIVLAAVHVDGMYHGHHATACETPHADRNSQER